MRRPPAGAPRLCIALAASALGLTALTSLACCGRRASEPPASPTPPGVPASAAPIVTPLLDAGFKLEWGRPSVPAVVVSGETFAAAVIVKNAGTEVWLDPWSSGGTGAGAVRLGYRWWKIGDMRKPFGDYADARGELPGPLPPGQTAVLVVQVAAPSKPGKYNLQLDLVQELVSWFESKGAPILMLPVEVVPRSRTETRLQVRSKRGSSPDVTLDSRAPRGMTPIAQT